MVVPIAGSDRPGDRADSDPTRFQVSLDGLPDVLKADEAAEILRIGRRQMYELLRSGRLPAVRVNNVSWRVTRAALEGYLSGEADPSDGP